MPRGIRLTAAGARLLAYAGRIEALVAEAAADARGHPRALSGPFRLGAIEITDTSILSDRIARFLAAHDEVELRLERSDAAQTPGSMPLHTSAACGAEFCFAAFFG
ncbi:hypothetical protein [Mesorhizobium sp. M1E.F.Ca.ET.063.01.1.1]|uniref:hypothetical protein n=1 Tax=Mesorhizobium sp. M1E.F.Ca.ET.063.01.1.1 TaxID=2496750 RepID=UPI001FE09E85|nr:hypothetical protein [Mesorhizobium sp. M1E.F.Ca.ET.063.01.1.1]